MGGSHEGCIHTVIRIVSALRDGVGEASLEHIQQFGWTGAELPLGSKACIRLRASGILPGRDFHAGPHPYGLAALFHQVRERGKPFLHGHHDCHHDSPVRPHGTVPALREAGPQPRRLSAKLAQVG